MPAYPKNPVANTELCLLAVVVYTDSRLVRHEMSCTDWDNRDPLEIHTPNIKNEPFSLRELVALNLFVVVLEENLFDQSFTF